MADLATVLVELMDRRRREEQRRASSSASIQHLPAALLGALNEAGKG